MDTRSVTISNNISLFKSILAEANALLKEKRTQTEENFILETLTNLKSQLIQMMGEGDSNQKKEMTVILEEAQGLMDSLNLSPSEKKNQLSSNPSAYFNNTIAVVSGSSQSSLQNKPSFTKSLG